MYTYLKTKFPNIIEPKIEPYKYKWELFFGCMIGRRINICLTELENGWKIDAFREIISEGRIVDTSFLLHTCLVSDNLGKAILDEIGNWLEDFSNYKEHDNK